MTARRCSRNVPLIPAFVRSSAVRPGVRSAQSPPTDTLLRSPIDRSMQPFTSQRPASITSAPTDSRSALIVVATVVDLA